MKRILLSTATMALLFTTACTSTTTEDTNINATDTVNMLPPADNTGPGIEGANPDMRDPNSVDMNSNPPANSNTGGSGSTTNSGSPSNSGSNSATTNSPSTNRSNNSRGPQEVVVPAAPAKDEIKSTYKRAAPGDTVDGRTNMGSSR